MNLKLSGQHGKHYSGALRNPAAGVPTSEPNRHHCTRNHGIQTSDLKVLSRRLATRLEIFLIDGAKSKERAVNGQIEHFSKFNQSTKTSL